MTPIELRQAFDQLQMGAVYYCEIGDVQGLEDVRRDLERLAGICPELAISVRSLLKVMMPSQREPEPVS
jgi:hypothetical protein